MRKEVSIDDVQVPAQMVRSSENFRSIAISNPIALKRAIAQLPSGYRAAFILYHVHGNDDGETRVMLGHSEATSKSQLFKPAENCEC